MMDEREGYDYEAHAHPADEKYKPTKFTFEKLKAEHGIFAVRGPRGIPESLSEALK